MKGHLHINATEDGDKTKATCDISLRDVDIVDKAKILGLVQKALEMETSMACACLRANDVMDSIGLGEATKVDTRELMKQLGIMGKL